MKLEGSRSWNNPIYSKLYSIWKSMKSRCYNENDTSYKDYGGKGVTICDRWLTFDNFIEDIDSIDGFDYDKWMNGELHLDKDVKQKNVNNKIYSKDTCMFITPKENSVARPNTIESWVVNPEGKLSKEKNMEEYARDNNLDTRHVYEMIFQTRKDGYKIKHVKGYQFFQHKPNDNEILKRKVFLATTPEGEKIKYYSNKYITDKYKIPSYSIQRSIREGKTTKNGWKFELIQEGYYLLD